MTTRPLLLSGTKQKRMSTLVLQLKIWSTTASKFKNSNRQGSRQKQAFTVFFKKKNQNRIFGKYVTRYVKLLVTSRLNRSMESTFNGFLFKCTSLLPPLLVTSLKVP